MGYDPRVFDEFASYVRGLQRKVEGAQISSGG